MQRRFAACLVTALIFLAHWEPAEAQRYPSRPELAVARPCTSSSRGSTLTPMDRGPSPSDISTEIWVTIRYTSRWARTTSLNQRSSTAASPNGFPSGGSGGGGGGGGFSVTVPAGWPIDQTVIWSFESGGEIFSAPSSFHEVYELKFPMAMGSSPPFLRMEPEGEESFGIRDPLFGEPKTARVGEPLELTAWVRDQVEPEGPREEAAVRVTIWRYQGPAPVTIVAEQPPEGEEPEGDRGGGRRGGSAEPPLPNSVVVPLDSDDGAANFTVTFDEPGR